MVSMGIVCGICGSQGNHILHTDPDSDPVAFVKAFGRGAYFRFLVLIWCQSDKDKLPAALHYSTLLLHSLGITPLHTDNLNHYQD